MALTFVGLWRDSRCLYKVINLNDNKTACVCSNQKQTSRAQSRMRLLFEEILAFTSYGDIEHGRYYRNAIASFHGLLLHYVPFFLL
jgi:hypothetical protein